MGCGGADWLSNPTPGRWIPSRFPLAGENRIEERLRRLGHVGPIEVTHDSPAEVQWELRVQGAPVGDPGWTVYRAFYVESLQPSTAR